MSAHSYALAVQSQQLELLLQARRLTVGHPERFAINFTRNRLCAIARGALGLTSANMLDRLLDPMVRLATSTPGADPAGDCAWVVFARAETVRPGARAALEAKAQQTLRSVTAVAPLASFARFRTWLSFPCRRNSRSVRPTA